MIPILYAKDESNFTHNGIGFLKDAVKVQVTEERNGAYELSLQYPVTGQWYSNIGEGCIIKAKANETSEPQLFRIYKSSKPLKDVVTYNAEHISYDLNGIPTLGISVKSATPSMAMQRAVSKAALPCNFSMVSDISTLKDTAILTPCSIRAVLGGQSGSVLDVWGGEFEFDNFTVKLHANRGADNGVTIAYGKNLTDLKQERNISECYTHLLPYAKYSEENDEGESEEIYVYLSEGVIPLVKSEGLGHSRAHIMDFTSYFEDGETITEGRLREIATDYAATAELGTPKVNITVSFVQLWQTEEYKNIAPLERVKLCDTVTVLFPELGVKATSKVITTVYDSLKEKYTSITLGDAKSTLADTLNNQNSEIENIKELVTTGQAKASEELKKAILNATNLITGHSGGYVVLNPAEMPQEILILDAPTIEEAVKVWRWNSSGLGYSTNGYNGDYKLAITMDGYIVADFIGAGTLNGALLQADSVQASAISAEFKQQVTDDMGVIQAAITQEFKAADAELLSSISAQLGDYATRSEIEQLEDEISLVVTSTSSGKKINSAEIIAAINNDTSTVTLAANKLDLTSYAKIADVTDIAEDAAATAAADEISGITLTATNYSSSSTIRIKHNGVTVDSVSVKFTGMVTFDDLETAGATTINGANITTGIIEADMIDTENLSCTSLYAKDNYDGYCARLNGSWGDFGIFHPDASTSAEADSAYCMFGIYQSDPTTEAVNFYVYGNNFAGFSGSQGVFYAKGIWDFNNATVRGI